MVYFWFSAVIFSSEWFSSHKSLKLKKHHNTKGTKTKGDPDPLLPTLRGSPRPTGGRSHPPLPQGLVSSAPASPTASWALLAFPCSPAHWPSTHSPQPLQCWVGRPYSGSEGPIALSVVAASPVVSAVRLLLSGAASGQVAHRLHSGCCRAVERPQPMDWLVPAPPGQCEVLGTAQWDLPSVPMVAGLWYCTLGPAPWCPGST